jgi:hypothetical protein
MAKKKRGIMTLLAAAAAAVLGGSGCYMLNGPYAYVRIDTPDTGANPPAGPVVAPAPHHVDVSYEHCFDYAASAADSMHPDGRRVRMCTCYDRSDSSGGPDPHSAYLCEYAEH